METNNYTTNLQLVSQEYPDEKTSLQTKTKKLLEYFSPKDIWKIKGLIFACLVACFLYVTYLTHNAQRRQQKNTTSWEIPSKPPKHGWRKLLC